MNKRITSLILVFALVVTTLAVAAVPSFAATTTKLYMIPDKPEAHPGDTITYTVKMGAVTNVAYMKLKLVIPTGLTYVVGSGVTAPNIQTIMAAGDAEYTDSTKVWLVGDAHYSSAEDTTLFTFKCTVDEDASGDKAIEFTFDPDDNFDTDEENITLDVSSLGSNVHITPASSRPLILQAKPTQLVYSVGEELNKEGLRMAIKAPKGAGAIVDNDACQYTYDFSRTGKAKVFVSYTDDEGVVHANRFTVTVSDIRQIVLASKPSKLYYAYGEALVTDGLTVLAKYTDGNTRTIEAAELTVSGYDASKSGVQKLTVAYGEFAQTTEFSVKVAEKKFSDAMILDADFSDSDPTDGVGGRVPAVTNVTYVNDTEINRTVAAFNISNMKYPLADPDDYAKMASKCTLEAYVNVGGANQGTWAVIAGPFSFRSQGGMALCTGSLAGFGSGPMSVTAGKNKNIEGGATGTWKHVVWTFDAGTMNLYVDGTLASTGSYGANVISFDTTTGLMIGAHDDGSNFAIVNSKIAFVRLYSDCATAEQVTELYNAR